MGRILYYLVNETHKEFCFFNDRVPIYEELKRIIDTWSKWSPADRIIIKGQEDSKGSDLWDHLTMNLEYKDLDYYEHMAN
jgi:hypothetical protein